MAAKKGIILAAMAVTGSRASKVAPSRKACGLRFQRLTHRVAAGARLDASSSAVEASLSSPIPKFYIAR